MLSRFALSIGGSLLATLTGVYIFWGPTKKRSKGGCRGLENVGNSCFLNSLLQSWAACPSLYSWLQQSVDGSRNPGLLTTTILKILKILNNEVVDAPDPYNPSDILRALRVRRWVITPDEQDAHELFHVLTETLEEETAQYPSVLSLFDGTNLQDPRNTYQSSQEACTRSKGMLPVLPSRTVKQPTHGLLASQLQCLTCGARSPVKYDVFDSLSLSFPRDFWGSLSLDSLFQHFITPEIVQDVDCPGCAKMTNQKKVKSNFRKRVSIGKLPQVLCIHLHRTQWLNNGAAVKRFDHVSFPEILHMDPYLYSKQERGKGLQGGGELTMQMLSQAAKSPTTTVSAPVNLLRTLNFDQQFTGTGLFLQRNNSPQIPRALSDINHNAPPELLKSQISSEFSYRLASVICHIGDVLQGHFVAYRRGIHAGGNVQGGAQNLGPRWWYTSDCSVRKVPLDQVLSSEAYMLFYERI